MLGNELFLGLINGFKSKKRRYIFLILSILSSIICAIFTYLHYINKFYGNPVTWVGWIISIILMIVAFFPQSQFLKNKLKSYINIGTLIFILLGLFFIISHLWNFKTAPWNQNGVFDDASWEIYFAKAYIFTDKVFQPAYFLLTIARELLHHYYITLWFIAFGYNLLVFNYSLIFLGLITFIFTTLLIHKMFNNYIVTILSAVIFNFLPLQFIETFVGHHYAPVVPLMMISLYFLYTGFKNKSFFRIFISSLFAALCLSTAVMGKQYLMGLAAALIVFLVLNFKKTATKSNWNLLKLFIIGFVISALPMLIYILFNYGDYTVREKGYTDEFFNTFKIQGFEGIKTLYFDRLMGIFFDKYIIYREFMPNFLLIPIAYYFFLVPGLVIAFIKKRYEIIILALLPVAGAFIAGGYDFRVLHAAPFWIILMAFTMNEILRASSKNFGYASGTLNSNKSKLQRTKTKKSVSLSNNHTSPVVRKTISCVVLALSLTVLLVGLVPCISYLDALSKDPNSISLFPHRDVGICRYIRDIVAGVPNPSPEMRWNDYKKIQGIPEPNFDSFVCQDLGYAIAHTFLEDYGDEKILSFSNGLPDSLLSEAETLDANKLAINLYSKNTKDLKLIWQVTDKTKNIIEKFKTLNYLGNDETMSSAIDGRSFSVYVLTIKNKNIDKFKHLVE